MSEYSDTDINRTSSHSVFSYHMVSVGVVFHIAVCSIFAVHLFLLWQEHVVKFYTYYLLVREMYKHFTEHLFELSLYVRSSKEM